jgi:hypothetical protein
MLKGSSVSNFIERHNDKIKGVTSCFDRIVLTGTRAATVYSYSTISIFFGASDAPDFTPPSVKTRFLLATVRYVHFLAKM